MSKVTETRDVQTQYFGINANTKMLMEGSAATGATATTLTKSGATWTTNQFAGQCVFANSAANTATQATEVYGVVQSNTSTVLTVDGWTTLAGASGSTPSTTTFYIIGPPPPYWFIALSDSVAAVAGTETAVAMGGTELTTAGLGRAIADTFTHTAGTTTTVLGKTFTYTAGSPQTVGRMMVASSRVANKGFAYFITQFGASATPSTNGDTVTVTDTITVG